jgi:hypothetical protein
MKKMASCPTTALSNHRPLFALHHSVAPIIFLVLFLAVSAACVPAYLLLGPEEIAPIDPCLLLTVDDAQAALVGEILLEPYTDTYRPDVTKEQQQGHVSTTICAYTREHETGLDVAAVTAILEPVSPEKMQELVRELAGIQEPESVDHVGDVAFWGHHPELPEGFLIVSSASSALIIHLFVGERTEGELLSEAMRLANLSLERLENGVAAR